MIIKSDELKSDDSKAPARSALSVNLSSASGSTTALSGETSPPNYTDVFGANNRAGPSRPPPINGRRSKREAALETLATLANQSLPQDPPSPPPGTAKTVFGIPLQLPSSLLFRQRSESRALAAAQAAIDAQVRETVLLLVRDIVKDVSQPDSVDILQRCLVACQMRGISFPQLMQQRSIEGHTPLYWAIISAVHDTSNSTPAERSMSKPQSVSHSVIDFLVSYPLLEDAKADARQACLVNSDNELFQRMRRAPGFERQSYADEVIAGGRERVESVYVEILDSASGVAFRIHFRIENWLTKMRIAKRVPLEFIARGRSWSLVFFVVTEGSGRMKTGRWFGELHLLDDSAPTWIHGQLTVPPGQAARDQQKRKHPMTLQFKPCYLTMTSEPCRVKLKSSNGELLEFDDSPYISSDGSLRAMCEFRLEKVGGDCIIC